MDEKISPNATGIKKIAPKKQTVKKSGFYW